MLVVTEAASARLARVLGRAGLPENAVVRLARQGAGVTLQSDAERPGDNAFQHNGRAVLVLDARVSELLSASTLDVEGDEFTLR